MARFTAQRLQVVLAAGVFATTVACGSDPSRPTPTSQIADPSATTTSQPGAAVSHFLCDGMPARWQVHEQVTGGLTATGQPVDVVFSRVVGAVLLAQGAAPVLDPNFWGGEWKTLYGLDAWRVQTTDVGTYTLLLPPGPFPPQFGAMAVIEYTAGGNYQDILSCALQ